MELPRHFLVYILPYIFGLAALEIVWYLRKKRTYAWGETLASLGTLVIRRLFFVGLTAKLMLIVGGYLSPHRLFDLPVFRDGQWQLGNAVVLFVLLEFTYYWFHRWSHTVRILWASHSVHHSSNKINFLTAERLGWTGGVGTTLLIGVPLILLGFDVKTVTLSLALNLLYQYWLHTEMIGSLGWFEYVFNTPAHHRVHHASNVSYLDANYGGVLIIFDRLFGTLALESREEPLVYGLVKPLYSFNPVRIAMHEWLAICVDLVKHWRRPRAVLGFLFGPPGWSPDGSRQTSKQLQAERGLDRVA